MGLFYIRGDEERAKEGPDVASITSDKDIEVVGTLARITRVNAAKGDSFILLVVGIRRIKVVRQVESQGPMMRVQIEEIKPKKSGNDQVIKAYSLEALNCLKEFTQYNSLNREQFQV
jgi:ATP-dependent Lon protease